MRVMTVIEVELPQFPRPLQHRITSELSRADAEMAERRRHGGARRLIRPNRRSAAARARFDAVVGDIIDFAGENGVPPYRLVSIAFGLTDSASFQLLRAWHQDHPVALNRGVSS